MKDFEVGQDVKVGDQVGVVTDVVDNNQARVRLANGRTIKLSVQLLLPATDHEVEVVTGEDPKDKKAADKKPEPLSKKDAKLKEANAVNPADVPKSDTDPGTTSPVTHGKAVLAAPFDKSVHGPRHIKSDAERAKTGKESDVDEQLGNEQDLEERTRDQDETL